MTATVRKHRGPFLGFCLGAVAVAACASRARPRPRAPIEAQAHPSREDGNWFGDSFVEVYPGRSGTGVAVLLLHGFPAEQDKNQSIATRLAADYGWDAHLIHYEGLGKSRGVVSLTRAIVVSNAYAKKLSARYRHLFLIGHSFGGLVALAIMREQEGHIAGAVLLAPLSNIPEQNKARQLLADIRKENPRLAPRVDTTSLVLEMEVLRTNHHPWHLAQQLDGDGFLILQGSEDEVVPWSDTDTLAKRFASPTQVVVVNGGHTFSDRDEVPRMLGEWIQSRLSVVEPATGRHDKKIPPWRPPFGVVAGPPIRLGSRR